LAVGSPVLYVGPERSHISDAFESSDAAELSDAGKQRERSSHYVRVDFGDVVGLRAWLDADWANWKEVGRTTLNPVSRSYSQELLLPQLVRIVEDRVEL
jgi:hypothetical protein